MFFTITAKGTNIAPLLPANTNLPIIDQAFELSSKVRFENNELVLESFTTSIAQTQTVIDLRATLTPAFEKLTFDLKAQGRGLGELTPYAADMPDTPFNLMSQGRWDAGTLTLDAGLLQLGETTLDITGTIATASDESHLKIGLDVKSMKAFEFIAKRPLPDENLKFQASIIISGNDADSPGTLSIQDLVVTSGKSDLKGHGTYQFNDKPDFDFRLESDELDLDAFLIQEEQTTTASQTDQMTSDRVIPDIPIPIELLEAANGAVHITVGKLAFSNVNYQDVVLLGSLKNKSLNISRFAATSEGGTLSGKLAMVTNLSGGVDVTTTLAGQNLIIGFEAKNDQAMQQLPRYSVNASLSGQGAGLRELASTLNGYLRIVGGKGKMAFTGMGIFTRDFASQILDTVNPFAGKEEYTEVQCLALLIAAVDGRLVGFPAMAFQTDKVYINLDLTVDLATEKLEAQFETQARKGLGIGLSDLVNPFTFVGGTLASPTLELSSKGILIHAATGGLSFLLLKAKQRFFSNENPCNKAIQVADEVIKDLG
jgi:hypothetical protein